MDFFFSVQELLDIEGVLGVIIGGVLVVRVLGQVVLVAQKRAHTPQLQDALAAIQHCQFIPAHKFVAEFLIVGSIAWAIATGIRIVVAVDGFLAECFGKIFQGGRLTAAEENLAVHVAHDGIRIIFVDGFQLAAGLQDQTRRDLTAADGSHQLFQLRNLTDVSTLIDQAPHMDRQLAAVLVIRLIAEQIEKLGVDHGDQEVKGAVRITHDEKQRRFSVAQLVQFQLIVHGGIPDFLNIEGCEPGTAGNKDRLGRFARDKKSRTFSSNSKRSHILRTSSRSIRLILSSIVSFAVSLKWTRTI